MVSILIDMDGVVADINKKWLPRYNSRESIYKLFEKDIIYWDMKKNLTHKYGDVFNDGYGKEAYNKLMNVIQEKGFFRNLPLIDGCKNVIDKWNSMGYDIVFVSNGQFAPNSFIDKFNWVKDNFPYAELYLTGSNKSFVCGDIAIEDNPKYLSDYNCPYGLILLEKEYNKDCKNDRFDRVKNWNEIEELVDNLVRSEIDDCRNFR